MYLVGGPPCTPKCLLYFSVALSYYFSGSCLMPLLVGSDHPPIILGPTPPGNFYISKVPHPHFSNFKIWIFPPFSWLGKIFKKTVLKTETCRHRKDHLHHTCHLPSENFIDFFGFQPLLWNSTAMTSGLFLWSRFLEPRNQVSQRWVWRLGCPKKGDDLHHGRCPLFGQDEYFFGNWICCMPKLSAVLWIGMKKPWRSTWILTQRKRSPIRSIEMMESSWTQKKLGGWITDRPTCFLVWPSQFLFSRLHCFFQEEAMVQRSYILGCSSPSQWHIKGLGLGFPQLAF